jgi:2-polyprenyl-3-methyl-5-hydroxy-6-metoxy-1,4-benzoquinol methylase
MLPEQQWGELVHAEHLARYRLAARLAEGKRVLDAGCGEGYGTALLSAAGAKSVVGVDVDSETLEGARERYGLDFQVADVRDLPFPDGSFDLVVCFETIEHVEEPERALAHLRRVLAPDGILVISTPNANEYLQENEFHVREFTPDEFAALLNPQFPERAWLYQQNWLVSAILDADDLRERSAERPLDIELVKTAGTEPGRELYSIVLCGPIESLPTGVAVASEINEAHRLAVELNDARRENRAWQERAAIAEREIEPWRERATIAERQIEPWRERATIAEREIEPWRERAAEAERQVAETREQLAEARRTLEGLASSLSWRLTAPLRRTRSLLGPRR